MFKQSLLFLIALFFSPSTIQFSLAQTEFVNPFLGTATLWEETDLQYVLTRQSRTWGGEVFPGASLPNAMVQVSPVTMFHSGSGYQYEDTQICGFAHTNKGHWNLLHVPVMPITDEKVNPNDYASPFRHETEEAHPGYYRVALDRYGITAEVTSTLRCAFHRYSLTPTLLKGEESMKSRQINLVVDILRSNNRVAEWDLQQCGDNAFCGMQHAEGKIYFYAVCDHKIESIVLPKPSNKEMERRNRRNAPSHEVALVKFAPKETSSDNQSIKQLNIRVGFSFVSIEGAKKNLEAEMLNKDFELVRNEADATWNNLLGKIKVEGGTEHQRSLFYSTLYRSMLWPALRSDVDKTYTDARGQIVNNGHHNYTDPSFWDDYRNKLVLIGLLQPEATLDIIYSIIDKGEKRGGYMPTFFHGDHAATFISGSYLRGLTDFPLDRAYKLMLKNATVPGRGGRPYLDEYMVQGWIAEKDTINVPYYNEYKAAVTKTLEYAYDDYATALVADVLGDTANRDMLLQRSKNYKNVFDPSTGFFRGRIADGSWVRQFDPDYSYFAYMFRESNAWNNLFFAPHDPQGILALYPSKTAVEKKLDTMFSRPWNGQELENCTGFIGQYCHGNQPGHSIPYMYYFVGRQEKAQCVIDSLLNNFYDMGRDHLAYPGMDDAGEMSSWFVFNAIGLYTYSPADAEYIVTVPMFDRVTLTLPSINQSVNHKTVIEKTGNSRKIKSIRCDGKLLKGWFLPHKSLVESTTITINTDNFTP